MHWEAIYNNWFASKGWTAAAFQRETAQAYFQNKTGIVNAPTGSGKTYSIALPAVIDAFLKKRSNKGLFMLWITPLKALSNDIASAIESAAFSIDPDFTVKVRTGDTDIKSRKQIKDKPPSCLVTTPETVHLLLSSKRYGDYFKNLELVVVDEWHELMGSKRGVQVELALAIFKSLQPSMKCWGISATIGNLSQSLQVLIPQELYNSSPLLVRHEKPKEIEFITILPDEIERFPWSGHIGLSLLPKIIPVINKSKTTLIFTNTRAQSEIWYQNLLDQSPELAGRMAIHHGSLDPEVRHWVEHALHNEQLKAVVCTSSLDLGVDFRPVDTVIQIGSPKSVARFLQRAGRSGHEPNKPSKIYFLPTNSLEIIDAIALGKALDQAFVEKRNPVEQPLDVLLQFLTTLAVSDGFNPEKTFQLIRKTYSYRKMSQEHFQWAITYLTGNMQVLASYDEFKKLVLDSNTGTYIVHSRRIAMLHRMSIGTIVSDSSIWVKQLGKSVLGTIEEYFISKLKEGDAFVFAGRVWSFVKLEGNTALVKKSESKSATVPSWMGGRMSLSSEMSHLIRQTVYELGVHFHAGAQNNLNKETSVLMPLADTQNKRSLLPSPDELLIEKFTSRDGFHLFVYPFEGRMVNEGMAMLFAYRLAKIEQASFSIAMNDYGFELLSAHEIPIELALELDLLNIEEIEQDLIDCANFSEMCSRRFSEIAIISGLLNRGTPSKQIKSKHLHASAKLFFEVFTEYDSDNLLLQQAKNEVFQLQLDYNRIVTAFKRIASKEVKIIEIKKPIPFCFSLLVDRLREQLSNEKLEDRIAAMLRLAE